MFVSFWVGGLLLASIAILSYVLTKTFFGVSGYWEKVLFWRETQRIHHADRFALGASEVDAMLSAETEQLLASLSEEERLAYDAALKAEGSNAVSDCCAPVVRAPATAFSPWVYLAFLIGLLAGGWIAAQFFHQVSLNKALPEIGLFSLLTTSLSKYALLLVAGILVGFGTRMMGGCTSGHGLVGCSAGKLTSILATVVFFGVAIITNHIINFLVVS